MEEEYREEEYGNQNDNLRKPKNFIFEGTIKV